MADLADLASATAPESASAPEPSTPPGGTSPRAGDETAGQPLSLAIELPQHWVDGARTAARIVRFARAAERLGFDGAWVLDTPQGRQPVLEPFSVLGQAAAATRRIRLGVAVIVVPLRSPVELARTAAALDQLSGGRLELGLGLGRGRERVRAVGLDPRQRVERLTDAIAAIRALWTGEPVTLEGETITLREWLTLPAPLQRPGPRVWIGGHHPAALRRAAILGDGWVGAGSVAMATFAREAAVVREALAELGRDAAGFGIGKRLYLAIEDRRGQRAADLRRWFAGQYGDATLADRVALSGPPAAIVEGVLELVGHGARLVILNPLSDEERQLRVLAEEVLPAVRAATASSAQPSGPALP